MENCESFKGFGYIYIYINEYEIIIDWRMYKVRKMLTDVLRIIINNSFFYEKRK